MTRSPSDPSPSERDGVDADGLDDGELVTVFEAATEFEARSMVIVLEDAGIPACTFGAGDLPSIPSLTSGRRPTVPVQVARRDVAEAEAIIADLPQRADAIAWDTIDVGRPDEAEAQADWQRQSFFASPQFLRIGITILVLGAILFLAGLTLTLLQRSP